MLLLIGLQKIPARGADPDENAPSLPPTHLTTSTSVLNDAFIQTTHFEDYDLDTYCVVEPENTKGGEITKNEKKWAAQFITDYTAIYANYSKSANKFSEKIKNAVKDLKFWIEPIIESR